MKSGFLLSGLILASTILLSPAMAANYKIDISGQHASITFRANHLGFSYIAGRFNKFDGSFSHDRDNPAASSVEVTIDASSIDTNHAERDKHLRSVDFLEVSKYPQMHFVSSGYSASADGDILKGNLTIRNVTRPLEIKLRQVGEGKDPWGGYRSGFRGQARFNAADFAMPEWVGEIEIEVNIEGVRQ